MYDTSIHQRINYSAFNYDMPVIEKLKLLKDLRKYGSIIDPVSFSFSRPWSNGKMLKRHSLYRMTFTFHKSKIKFVQ